MYNSIRNMDVHPGDVVAVQGVRSLFPALVPLRAPPDPLSSSSSLAARRPRPPRRPVQPQDGLQDRRCLARHRQEGPRVQARRAPLHRLGGRGRRRGAPEARRRQGRCVRCAVGQGDGVAHRWTRRRRVRSLLSSARAGSLHGLSSSVLLVPRTDALSFTANSSSSPSPTSSRSR